MQHAVEENRKIWASRLCCVKSLEKKSRKEKEKSMRTMVATIAMIARLQHSTVTVRVSEVL